MQDANQKAVHARPEAWIELAGGVLAAADAVIALAGHPGAAGASDPNCKLGPCPAADTRPDLVATFFPVQPFPQGGGPAVRFDVSNQGLSIAAALKMKLLVNGRWVGWANETGGLAPGAMIYYYAHPLPPGGNATIQVIVDYDNQVDEANESDNITQTAVWY